MSCDGGWGEGDEHEKTLVEGRPGQAGMVETAAKPRVVILAVL